MLNARVMELTAENSRLTAALMSVTAERDHLSELSTRLQRENSKKWKFQERDDWKSLVDTVQADRSRLADENTQLQAVAAADRRRIDELLREVATLRAAQQAVGGGGESSPLPEHAAPAHLTDSAQGPATPAVHSDTDASAVAAATQRELDRVNKKVSVGACVRVSVPLCVCHLTV
jgi:hypothetical protein